MTQPVRASALVPAGFVLERVIPGDAIGLDSSSKRMQN